MLAELKLDTYPTALHPHWSVAMNDNVKEKFSQWGKLQPLHLVSSLA